MSPEQAKTPELTPYEALVADLKRLCDSKLLDPEIVFEIPFQRFTEQNIASCGNQPEGVYQDLRAVVKSGDELYFVIDSITRFESSGLRRPDFVESTLVAKYVPRQRAEIVDISRKRGRLDVGSDPTPQLALDEQKPKNHFSVAQTYDRTIHVIDHSSEKGTVVYTKKVTDNPEQIRPISHDAWSVKSAELKAAIESSKN